MATTNTEESTTSQATAAQQALEASAPTIVSQATQQLSGLTLIRQARVNQLQRQSDALAAQPDASNSAIANLQNQLNTQQIIAAGLGVAQSQASTSTPGVPTGGWVLYGYVRDQNLQPLPLLTVCLVNEQKAWLRAYGYAFTSSTGYFEINYSPPKPASRKKVATTARAEQTNAEPVTVYLEILNQKRQPIYIDSSSFSIAVGAAVYREVPLASTAPLGSAPPGAGAAPPAAK